MAVSVESHQTEWQYPLKGRSKEVRSLMADFGFGVAGRVRYQVRGRAILLLHTGRNVQAEASSREPSAQSVTGSGKDCQRESSGCHVATAIERARRYPLATVCVCVCFQRPCGGLPVFPAAHFEVCEPHPGAGLTTRAAATDGAAGPLLLLLLLLLLLPTAVYRLPAATADGSRLPR
jgi:hypothetical protein